MNTLVLLGNDTIQGMNPQTSIKMQHCDGAKFLIFHVH